MDDRRSATIDHWPDVPPLDNSYMVNWDMVNWASLHCRISWQPEHVDDFIANTLAPAMEVHRAAGRVTDWFYIRYWESGPHLRVRYRGTTDVSDELRELIADAEHPVVELDPGKFYASIGAPDIPWLPHGDVREVPYKPETERYGGEEALVIAEDLFCRSTEVAVAVLRSAQSLSAKLTAAIELTMTTTIALDLDRPTAAARLRTMAASWRLTEEPTTPPTVESHIAAHKILSKHGANLGARWDREPQGATAHWMNHVRSARAKVDVPYVWGSQLHMLLNRIGVDPDQERMICWVVAASALSPDGVTPFHDDGPQAPDRRYLEASKFLPGFTEQHPRKAVAHPMPAMPWHRDVTLPEPDAVPTSLVRALKARHTSREAALSGTLDAKELATLLWTAHGSDRGRHPYPSPGAQYCARLRVIALNVDGLQPGCYDVDEADRKLVWTAPSPSISDLESTSMWFGPEVTSLDKTPAVLALYVKIGSLRQTYGARALRFAFVEAGHLAQNLGLVAAALSLSMGVIGGIYDDLAHDLLALDGVNDTLVYLLPVARSESGLPNDTQQRSAGDHRSS